MLESTFDGTTLKIHGVISDIEVPLDCTLLSQGVDSQLEAVIGDIQQELQESK